MTDLFVVIVNCGYSEWFQVQDVRTVGPFVDKIAAEEWANAINARQIEDREGATVKATVQPLNSPSAVEEYAV